MTSQKNLLSLARSSPSSPNCLYLFIWLFHYLFNCYYYYYYYYHLWSTALYLFSMKVTYRLPRCFTRKLKKPDPPSTPVVHPLILKKMRSKQITYFITSIKSLKEKRKPI